MQGDFFICIMKSVRLNRIFSLSMKTAIRMKSKNLLNLWVFAMLSVNVRQRKICPFVPRHPFVKVSRTNRLFYPILFDPINHLNVGMPRIFYPAFSMFLWRFFRLVLFCLFDNSIRPWRIGPSQPY